MLTGVANVLGIDDLRHKAKILHRDISLFNIMIGKVRNALGYRKGVLIDYDYALDLLKRTILSPISPEVWPSDFLLNSPRIERR